MLRAAFKEPIAFLGGAFAGALGLNLEEEPLRSWIERTASQASISAPVPPWHLFSCWPVHFVNMLLPCRPLATISRSQPGPQGLGQLAVKATHTRLDQGLPDDQGLPLKFSSLQTCQDDRPLAC